MATEPTINDLTTTKGCRDAVLGMRYCCRLLKRTTDAIHGEAEALEHTARIYRQTNDPMLARRAAVLEEQARGCRARFQEFNVMYREQGFALIRCADAIDAQLSQTLIMDLLNVNPVDRVRVEPGDGLMEIAYARGLENSAENRDKDWHESPLHGAVALAFMHEMASNAELEKRAHEKLFGAGGMFEFLPMYNMQPDGSMKRIPPPLRVADPAVDGHAPEDSRHG